MKTYATLTAAAALLAITNLAHALTLASSVIPTGINTGAACYVRNVGTTTISLAVRIVDRDGTVIPLSFDNCCQLEPGKTCLVRVDDPADDPVACSATTTGNVKNLRGTLEIQDTLNNLKVLIADELR